MQDNNQEEDLNEPLDLEFNGGMMDGEVITWTNQATPPDVFRFEWFNGNKPNSLAIYHKIDHWDEHVDEEGNEKNAGLYYLECTEADWLRMQEFYKTHDAINDQLEQQKEDQDQ